jgi:hypothetical protein
MKRYTTETERMANEVCDRHSIFVDGIERTEKEIQRNEIDAPVHTVWCTCHLCEDWRQRKLRNNREPAKGSDPSWAPTREIATEAQQADFWAGLPRVQGGVGRVGVDWGRVFTLLAIYGATLGVSGALGWGLAEIVTGLFGKGAR